MLSGCIWLRDRLINGDRECAREFFSNLPCDHMGAEVEIICRCGGNSKSIPDPPKPVTSYADDLLPQVYVHDKLLCTSWCTILPTDLWVSIPDLNG